jgi:hypothetical protein
VIAGAAVFLAWLRAQLLQLRVEPTHARFRAPQRDLGPRQRVLRRAPPHSGVLAVAPRSHTSLAVGFGTGDPDQNGGVPLGLGPPWTREARSRRGPPPPRPLDRRSTAQIKPSPESNSVHTGQRRQSC